MEHEGALFNINCRIVEASNLTAMDTNGKSDPYVYAYIVDDEGKKIRAAGEWRTNTIEKTLNPYWNEIFEIGKNVSLRVDDFTLICEVWDQDKWTSDDNIGTVRVPLWSLPQKYEGVNKPLDVWIPITQGRSWLSNELSNVFFKVSERTL